MPEPRRPYPSRRGRTSGAAVLLFAAAALAACERRGEPAAANAAAAAAAEPQEAPSAGPRKAAEPDEANAAAPAPPTASAPMSRTGYALVGTEPFWGGTVTGTDVRYMTPERQFGDVVTTRLSFGPGTETYRGTFRGRPFVLTLARGSCSDGMSDRAYAFSATLEVLGETRRGCADPEEPRPGS
jgi:uncharacterized membrane protein